LFFLANLTRIEQELVEKSVTHSRIQNFLRSQLTTQRAAKEN